eukprot:c25601_g1_i1.p1 GENE.c25601_g1_i1~~c25601_g1_i1.p1  ORF type:complete len:1177 (-),score=294.77 c25601_g1_i1:465-3995(-)
MGACRLGVMLRAVALAVCCSLSALASDSIIGCGGFVEFSPALSQYIRGDNHPDLSFVKVNLFTDEGIKKYSTNCAPNGYYFIPVYEFGSFVISIEGNAGWVVAPEQVVVKVNSDTQCNEGSDINFQFTGFQVSGAVTGDRTRCPDCAPGPKGVQVELWTAEHLLQQTRSGESGEYTFSNVPCGDYTVVATHPTWQFGTSRLPVTVGVGSSQVDQALTVTGYSVFGSVLADNEPILGVEIFLLSTDGAPISGCTLPSSVPDELVLDNQKVLCQTTSDAQGRFSFSAVPSGQYSLRPWYRSSTTAFDVQPASVSVNVNHADVPLERAFSVTGFSVSGTVNSPSGAPMEGVEILLNGKNVAVTDSAGNYQIQSMTTGVYTVTAAKPHTLFSSLDSFRILPSSPSLPPLVATHYHLCGTITIDQVPLVVPLLKHRDVVLTGAMSRQTTTNVQGHYCFDAVPGSYYITPTIAPEERTAGLLLQPQTLSVTITDKPTLDANFVQLVLTLSGAVECLGDCAPGLTVTLTKTNQPQATRTTTIQPSGEFEFKSTTPGEYSLKVQGPAHCWESDSIQVVVGEDNVSGLRLKQKGFLLTVEASHPCQLVASLESESLNFDITRGSNVFCVPAPGVWSIVTRSCFQFQNSPLSFNTAEPSPVQLTAEKFRISGIIKAPRGTSGKARPASVTISDQSGEQTQATLSATDKDGVWAWETYAAAGSRLQVTPISDDDVLFYPRSADVTVPDKQTCNEPLAAFVGRAGLVLDGNVSPAIEGAQITITTSDGTEVASAVTGADGNYVVGKLYDDTDYSITATLPGYHFQPVENMRGYFTATRLTSLQVRVVGEDGSPLEGALLSLSGGKGYRNNNPTGTDGTFTFPSLFPNSYHLRPFMKEYVFTPDSWSFTCSGQESDAVTFTAKRVGFSAYGSAMALGGQPYAGVGVVAINKGDNGRQEETQTDTKGRFRLRGLVPGQSYKISLRPRDGDVARIERSSPESFDVTVGEADIEGNDFIVFPKLGRFHITGYVDVSRELLGKVYVKLALKSSPKQTVASLAVDVSQFFSFPLLDPDTYQLSLACDLDPAYWQLPTVAKTVTLGDSDQHVELKYQVLPKELNLDEISSIGSFLTLVFIVVVFFGGRNYQAILVALQKQRSQGWGSKASVETQEDKDKSFSFGRKINTGRSKKK